MAKYTLMWYSGYGLDEHGSRLTFEANNNKDARRKATAILGKDRKSHKPVLYAGEIEIEIQPARITVKAKQISLV